jgi:hypothetical protein
MATAKSRTGKTSKRVSSTALRLQPPTEALTALLREQSRILKAIAKKQSEFDVERERLSKLSQSLFEGMQPLVHEREQLAEEVRQLFQELLAEGRLSRTAQKKVSLVYRDLVESGEIESFETKFESKEPSNNHPDWDFEEFDAPDDFIPPSGDRRASSVDSAKHAGGRPGNETLRGLFKRLAVALHPDLVQQETEQKRRTDVMKEVTRAYEEGNLARLLEIEQLWLSGSDVNRNNNADENAQLRELERRISELRQQQKELSAALRELRNSSPLSEFFGTRRVNQAVQKEQLEALLDAASEELEPLRQIRDFVRAFSEKKISLAEFMRGPCFIRADEFDIAEAMLEFVMNDLGSVVSGGKTSSETKKRRGAKRGKSEFDDVPF